jgi:hypothetical protein
VENEVTALTLSAAATIVRAMSRPVWPEVKERVAGVLGRADPDRARQVAEQLESTRVALATSGSGGRAAAEARWQRRLERMMADDPDCAGELAALVDQLQADLEGDESRREAAPRRVIPGIGLLDPPRRRRISVLGRIAILAVPVILVVACGTAIVLEIVDRPPRYSVGDCVTLEGAPPFGYIGGPDTSATGTVPCSRNGDDDKIARITRVEDDVDPNPFGYCEIPGDEDWFFDNGTETLYCIEV